MDDHNIDKEPFHITFHVDYEKNSLDLFGLVIYMYIYSVAQIQKCPTCTGTCTYTEPTLNVLTQKSYYINIH